MDMIYKYPPIVKGTKAPSSPLPLPTDIGKSCKFELPLTADILDWHERLG